MTGGKVLILGARSWIGYRLTEAFNALCPSVTLSGTSRAKSLADDFIHADTPDDFVRLLQADRQDFVINLLRGEDQKGRDINAVVASHCADEGMHYAYASSALALDGYSNHNLTEDLEPLAQSDYGQFKAACESDLKDIGGESLVLRFSSIHGWSPWRASRTESFLTKASSGKQALVDRGVYQNRLHDKVLAEAIAQTVLDRRTGAVHFGTVDSSEEIEFLRRVATAFGWSTDCVVEVGERRVNLATLPRRLLDWYPNRFVRTEEQTVDALLRCPELQKYRKKGRSLCH